MKLYPEKFILTHIRRTYSMKLSVTSYSFGTYLAPENLGIEGIIAKAFMQGNYIEGNMWGITVIGNVDINAGCLEPVRANDEYNPGENVFKDNGNTKYSNGYDADGEFQRFDLYNNSATTVYAQGNIWNTDVQDFDHIAAVVFDNADNSALGEVIYMPAGSNTGISTIATESNGNSQRYNIMGQPVDSNYRGIVIEKGKKTIAF